MSRYVQILILMIVQFLLIQAYAEPYGMADPLSDNSTDAEPVDPYGYFSIISDPPGADVEFDDNGQGTTPVTVEVSRTAVPDHRVIIRKDGYQDWTSRITHNPTPGKTEDIRAVLKQVPLPTEEPINTPTWEPKPEKTDSPELQAGYFSFLSDPGAAEVIFDGDNQGTTPVTVEVQTTVNPDHQVIIRKDGYQDWTSRITHNPTPGETEDIRAVLKQVPLPTEEPINTPTWEPKPEKTDSPELQAGYFSFLSDPGAAEVIFDGTNQGTTPVTVEVQTTVTPNHQVIIRKTGFEDWIDKIPYNPSPGETKEINAELVPVPHPTTEPSEEPTGKPEPWPTGSPEPQTGNFSFISSPAGAEVIFDESSLGSTPVSVRVQTTSSPDHQVTVRKDGYQDWITRITHNPFPGEIEEINAELVPVPHPTTKPVDEPTGEPTREPTFSPVENPVKNTDNETGFFLIESVPSGAKVEFDGVPQGLSPVTVEIASNGTSEHFILVQLPGYQDWTTMVHNNPLVGETETITANLVAGALNGSIRVTSDPPGGLAILDGSAIQTTPCTFTDVPAGMHTIGISKDGYNPYSTNVTVSEGAESVVSAALSPVTTAGSLTISSYPEGALVLLNNIAYGLTPVHIDAIAAGTYQMKLIKHGYQPVSQTVEIIAGNDTPITVYLPRYVPVTGSLVVRSFPSGGIVKVDAVEKGITPLKIRGLLPDSYNVRVSIPGYLSWIGIVDVVAGRETSIYATLAPKGQVMNTGSLSITSDPTGATVMINDYSQGRTPLLLQNLLPGEYKVTLSSPGYKSESVSARVNAGKTTDLHVPISPEPVKNLSADLIMLSDDASDYFMSHGRTEALAAFGDPSAGFTREGMYVISLDLNGTILSDGGNPDLVGKSLSEQAEDNVNTGILVASLARTGGGLLYDTSLSGNDPGQVSLMYVRPAISGVVIGTVIPVPEIALPDTGDDPSVIRDTVHDAVIQAREENEEDITIMGLNMPEDNTEIQVHYFNTRLSEDPDRYGIMNAHLMYAASAGGTGYLWLLDDTGAKSYSLVRTYAEMIDGNRGIYATSPRGVDGMIAMVDVPQATV